MREEIVLYSMNFFLFFSLTNMNFIDKKFNEIISLNLLKLFARIKEMGNRRFYKFTQLQNAKHPC